MKLLALLFIVLLGCILSHSGLSLVYAAMGLELWFQKMIPTLLPFMILSGVMVRMDLTQKVSMMIYPILKPIFRIRKNVCYAMLMGFVCGFPMGARVVDDLYIRNKLTKAEAEYLLAFCNNIGPVYFCGFVLPILGRTLVLPYLFGMYGLPLLYGLLLRYTSFRSLPVEEPAICDSMIASASVYKRLLGEIDNSIQASVENILSLGGYMILFNLFNLLPHLAFGYLPAVIAPLFEITGGLNMLKSSLPLYSLLVLSFGGLCCLAQTYSCISKSDLSIAKYIKHKVILTVLNCVYYLCWFLFFSASFLC